MKAILFGQHGGPEILRYADFLIPSPFPGKILMQIRTAAFNKLECTCDETAVCYN